MAQDTRLLIIDPQNDFCDLSERDCPAGQQPALPVPGAHADMRRLARALASAPQRVTHLAVTLDTHQYFDIAHPAYWCTADGDKVPPFTEITAQAVRTGVFRPRDPADSARTLAYLDTLENTGRYLLMVWPVHCVQGNWGQQIHDEVQAACQLWSQHTQTDVLMVSKGLNPYTEHYSALQAEVPDPQDPTTRLNRELLEWATAADALWIAGEASSHCVRATVAHLLAYMPPGHPQRVTLLTDCMSPVGGFETQHRDFLNTMAAAGVQLASAAERFHQPATAV